MPSSHKFWKDQNCAQSFFTKFSDKEKEYQKKKKKRFDSFLSKDFHDTSEL